MGNRTKDDESTPRRRKPKQRSARAVTYRKGSIYQDKTGTWWYQPPQENGQRHPRIRCLDREAAELAQADWLANKRAGIDAAEGRQTVAAWLSFWYEQHAKPNIKPKTAHFYRQMLESYVIPVLGDHRLDKLNADHIVQLVNQLRENLSPLTVRHVYSVLRRALDRAVKARKIPYNPAEAVDPPKAPRTEQTPFTLAQSRAILKAVKGHRLEVLYHIALLLGLRKGEVLGLRWVDFNEAAATIKVTQQIQTVDGETRPETPKSETSRRTLPLPPLVIELLQTHWQEQQEERRRLGVEWHEHGLIFPNEHGKPMLPRNLSRHWYKVLAAAGIGQKVRDTVRKRTEYLGKLPFHRLRHTAATRLSENGASEAVIAAILGHSRSGVTAGYVHASLDEMRAAIERVDRLLRKAA